MSCLAEQGFLLGLFGFWDQRLSPQSGDLKHKLAVVIYRHLGKPFPIGRHVHDVSKGNYLDTPQRHRKMTASDCKCEVFCQQRHLVPVITELHHRRWIRLVRATDRLGRLSPVHQDGVARVSIPRNEALHCCAGKTLDSVLAVGLCSKLPIPTPSTLPSPVRGRVSVYLLMLGIVPGPVLTIVIEDGSEKSLQRSCP